MKNAFDDEMESAQGRRDEEVRDAIADYDTEARVECARCGCEFRESETRVVPGPTPWPELEAWFGVSLCKCDAADLEEASRLLDLYAVANPVPTEDPFGEPPPAPTPDP